MILPEDVKKNDLVGVFSTDGTTFRGMLTVRDCMPGYVAFNQALPPGTIQGDILCLIRRGDEHEISTAIVEEGPLIMAAMKSQHQEAMVEVMNLRNEIRARVDRELVMQQNLNECHERISSLRNMIETTQGFTDSDLLRRYRSSHRIDNDCVDEELCGICRAYEEMLRLVNEDPDSESLPVRRIKSTTT